MFLSLILLYTKVIFTASDFPAGFSAWDSYSTVLPVKTKANKLKFYIIAPLLTTRISGNKKYLQVKKN